MIYTGFVAAVLLSDDFLYHASSISRTSIVFSEIPTPTLTDEWLTCHLSNSVFAPNGGIVLPSTSLETQSLFDPSRDVTVLFGSDCRSSACASVRFLVIFV